MPSTEKVIKSELSGALDSFLDSKKIKKAEDQNSEDPGFLSITDFIDRFKLLPQGLYPVQKFILKLYYNIPLDDVLPDNKFDRIRITNDFGVTILYELTEVQYLQYLYSQGRCNLQEQDGKERRELILVLGRRSGKCVTGETLVLTDRGIVQIDSLGDPSGQEWQDLNIEIAQEGPKIRSKSSKFYNDSIRSTKSITTSCGYNICGTPNHRIKVLSSDGLIEWRYLDDIKSGDLIGIHRETDLWSSTYVDTRHFHTDCLIPHHLVHPLDVQEKICNWLRQLKEPVIRSRAKLASDFNTNILVLQSALLSIQRRFKQSFRHVTFSNSRSGSQIKWYPTNIPFSKDSIINRRQVKLPPILNEDWGLLLGILVGDGTWRLKSSIQITGGCEEFREKLEEFLDKLFGHHTLRRKINKPSTCPNYPWNIRVHSSSVRKFLFKLGYDFSKPQEKHIPWSILRSPKSVVAAFLRGFFETDGGMEKNGSTISACTASIKLASEIQIVLLNFGIISKIRWKWNKKYRRYYYGVYILGYESRKRFYEQIGFITHRKSNLLIKGLKNGDNGHSATDSVPNQKDRLRRLIASVPISHNNTFGTSDRKRTWLKEACGNVCKPSSKENISYQRLDRVISKAKEYGADSSIIAELENIHQANYFWDNVVKIEDGNHKVYDLTVPKGESFVANGMTNHNSSLASIISAYELYKLLRRGHPQAYYGIPPSNEIRIMCVANDKEQASIVYGEMGGYIDQVDYFKSSQVGRTQSFMRFQTDHDRQRFGEGSKQKATLVATFKSSIAKGLRGRGIICAILDELAFFINDGRSGAEDIYKAIVPSIAQFSPKDPQDRRVPTGPTEGRIISISSPNAREGFFYKLYQLAMSKGKAADNMIVIQAPTWEVNPSLDKSYYETEYHKNPKAFATEHGAEFSDRVRGWIEDHKDLTDCIDLDLRPVVSGIPRKPYFAGVDFGIKQDGTAIALTHIKDGKVELAYHEVWYARRKWKDVNPHLISPMVQYAYQLQDVTRLDIDEIVKWFEVLSKRFYILKGILDQYAGHIFEQALHKKNLTQFELRNFTVSDSSQAFLNAKMMMFSRQLLLYDYPIPEAVETGLQTKLHSPLIQELLELQATSVGKNMMEVAAPEIAGKHDDISDSYVRSVLAASEYIKAHPGVLDVSGQDFLRPHRTPIYGFRQFQRIRTRLHGPPPKERTIPVGFKRR